MVYLGLWLLGRERLHLPFVPQPDFGASVRGERQDLSSLLSIRQLHVLHFGLGLEPCPRDGAHLPLLLHGGLALLLRVVLSCFLLLFFPHLWWLLLGLTSCRLGFHFLQAALHPHFLYFKFPSIFQRELHYWSLLRPKDFWIVVDVAQGGQGMLVLLELCKGVAQGLTLNFPMSSFEVSHHPTLLDAHSLLPSCGTQQQLSELLVIHGLWEIMQAQPGPGDKDILVLEFLMLQQLKLKEQSIVKYITIQSLYK